LTEPSPAKGGYKQLYSCTLYSSKKKVCFSDSAVQPIQLSRLEQLQASQQQKSDKELEKIYLLFDKKQKELAVKVAENLSGKGSISEESILFRVQDIYSRLYNTGTAISRRQADSNIIILLLEYYLITKMLIAVRGTEGLLTFKQYLQYLCNPRIGVQRLDTVSNILLLLDSLECQEEAIVIQHRFALIELASKYRKYINSKTGNKIGGKVYKRITNKYLGLIQTPSIQKSADKQSLANNQVVISK
jgi:hypothetical protein